MKISEIFRTIQGEGRYAGELSIFIRSTRCNLACRQCDTPYTSHYPETGTSMTSDQIVMHINREFDWTKHVVITGGEPFLQKDLGKLVDKLMDRDHFVSIETNGTIFNREINPTHFTISPKLTNFLPDDSQPNSHHLLHSKNNTYDDNNIGQFINSDASIPAAFWKRGRYGIEFKFVVFQENDIGEINEFVATYNIPKDRVWLMPEGYTVERLNVTSKITANLCLQYGYNFSPRLHIGIWGNGKANNDLIK